MTSRNSNFGGFIADEKQLSGTPTTGAGAASLGSYFQGVASYLPSSIKKQLHITPSSHHHNYEDDHVINDMPDIVLGAEFDKYETPSGEMHLCLMLSYNNGFQVWDLQHPDGKREIVSVREPTPIKSIKFIPNPIGKDPPNSLLAGKRPLLAVLSAEESSKFPRSNVKFYSLKANDYINILRFKSPVYTVECNQRILFVGLRDNIYGFDLVTMERVLSLPCYPSPLNNAVMALGSRWLATHQSSAANTNYVEVAKDVATDLAKEVANGLYYLGDMGRTVVSNYLYPEDGSTPSGNNSTLQPVPIEYKDTEHAGTKTLLHFRAHSQPLSLLRFDPSGTLLVSSSVDGHNFNVFQIGLSSGSGCGPAGSNGAVPEVTYRHLYKLVRGVTNATIQDISFSADSKWMAISSTRGTTRIITFINSIKRTRLRQNEDIYAINPQGGPVNVLTHVPASNRPADMLVPHKPDLPIPLVTLSVCNRIKTASSTDESTSRNSSTIGSTSRFVGLSPADERLAVFAKNGLLTLYQLAPHSPPQSDPDPLSLQLAISPMSEADMGRRTKWPEYRQSVKEASEKEPTAAQQEGDMKWLSNVEISTHSPHLRLLWLGCPQFSFRTYQNSTVPSSSSPTSRLHSTSDLLSTSPQNSNFDEFMSVGVLNTTHNAYSQAHTTSASTSTSTTTTTTSTSTTPAMGILFDENAIVPTKRVDIRRYEPQPFKDSLEDLHETVSSSPRTDDLIKEGILDAISTPMVTANKSKTSSGFDLSTKQSADITNARRPEVKSSPPQTSPFTNTTPSAAPASQTTNSDSLKDLLTRNITTSTSSLSPSESRTSALTAGLQSASTESGTSIPNYYSRYNPSSIPYSIQTTSTTSSTSPASPASPVPPANLESPASPAASVAPARNSPSIQTQQPPRDPSVLPPISPSRTSPFVQSPPPLPPITQSVQTTSSPHSSPVLTTSPTVPSSPSPATTSPPLPVPPTTASPTTTSPIPIASPARSIPTSNKPAHSPFSTSPPFPESEMSQPPSKKSQQPTSSTPPKKEEDDDEFSLVSRSNPPAPAAPTSSNTSSNTSSSNTTSTSSSKKKKKNKKKNGGGDREHEDESA